MSYHKITSDKPMFRVTPMEIRDFVQSLPSSANQKIDLWLEHLAIGLDIFIHNRGAASISVVIDKGGAITIEAGDTLTWTNIKYSLVEITAAVAYDFVVAGVHRGKKR